MKKFKITHLKKMETDKNFRKDDGITKK